MSRKPAAPDAVRLLSQADGQELAAWLIEHNAIDAESAIIARDIIAALGTGWTDRRIRAAAEACPYILSAPGCAGYAALAAGYASSQDYARECVARHRSQARHQLTRAERIEAAMHAADY